MASLLDTTLPEFAVDTDKEINESTPTIVVLSTQATWIATETSTSTITIPTDTSTATEIAQPSETDTPDVNIETVTVEADITCNIAENRSFESEVIRLINLKREENGIPNLIQQTQLTQAAKSHSEDMACGNYFSHISPEFGDLNLRLDDQNYKYENVGETIAAGFESPEEVVASWLESPNHREILLSADYSQIGVGFAKLDDSEFGTYWTVIVGQP